MTFDWAFLSGSRKSHGMIRALLVRNSTGDWRLYRQSQWMSEIRRNLEAAGCLKVHFDIEEPGFLTLLNSPEHRAGFDAERLAGMIQDLGGKLITIPSS
ncbi:MAG: hypothetical protein DWI24_06240 [Planctomycetota bacterium]|nr:MAG: hypothetical protein DWI24_06240 [Planctomycetota bacterium]